MPTQQQQSVQVDVALESAFATKKGREKSLAPSTFQVSAKIDEESRKDNRLDLSFLLTLNDPKNMVTYEFRGSCSITGNPASFDHVMGAHAGSRLPRILDVIYQKVYPSVFMLAGITSSPYPQLTVLAQELVVQEEVKPEEKQEPALQAEPQS
ncbi:MAG: hypothetical protein ACREAY_06225 [Nitrososphaera sp.]|uniref:hypothetical protein n=1 Tax=Nitrososphaera sp. TaxID=1971748 RepID=UPI003D6ED2AC